jgi:hypothetical protein
VGTHWSSLWFSYVFHKQTLRELSEVHGTDWRTIRGHFKKITLPEKLHTPRSIHLVVDTTYFGKRMDGTSWGVMLFRDDDQSENLWWAFCTRETLGGYLTGKLMLESLGYRICSITSDGFRGMAATFKGTPYQACQFHVRQRCTSFLTQNPQTEPGQVLLALVKILSVSDSHTFRNRLRLFHQKYAPFMNEKTTYPDGSSGYTHEGVRSAFLTLGNTLNYLFTYEHDALIPKTSNTCEGHFSHIKDVVRIHRGLGRSMKEKVIETILLESTIAPKERKSV